jgi:membrane fusion protein, multidrug efflux system
MRRGFDPESGTDRPGSGEPGGRRTAAGRARPLLIAALAALVLPALACGTESGVAAPPPGAPATAPSASAATRVTTAPVDVRDVASTIEALGSIEAEEEVQVIAGVEGVVTRVRLREGDHVTPQTVLAEIDPERYRLLAEQAKARVDTAVADQHRAESDLRRREELLSQTPPLVSAEEVERARQEVDRLSATAAGARAAWELAEQDRRRSIVRPLVSGVINSRSVETGQHVDDDTAIATIIDLSRLRLRFKVSETESVRLREGMEVSFTTAAWPGRPFTAKVFHVSSSADPGSRMVEALARIGTADEALKPGFFAEVKAVVESRSDALLVPERAVLATERGFVVFEVEDGVARRREVTLGLRSGDGSVEILSGLRAGAVVVTDGGAILKDGAPVVDARTAPPS